MILRVVKTWFQVAKKRYRTWKTAYWTSWDPHPWRHPWLTPENLGAFRDFSRGVLAHDEARADASASYQFGFCGNMANGMYQRAAPLRRSGERVDVVLHPDDRYVMSHPGWEEFDGVLPAGPVSVDELGGLGLALPEVPGVYSIPSSTAIDEALQADPRAFLPAGVRSDHREFLAYLPTLDHLQRYDALLAAQSPYLAYLSGRPYVVAQTGGEIWFEAARGDSLGQLQKQAYTSARLFLVSNPWSLAHARRYGLRNCVYLPLILDDQVYKPGRSEARAAWARATGGDFFCLSSSRIDNRVKGSRLGLEGFAAFAAKVPGARLVSIGWGSDSAEVDRMLADLGIRDRVLKVPVAGKERLRDYLRGADALLEQFVVGYYGAAGLEAMACGVPVVARLERAQYQALCDTGAPPVLQAENPGQVCEALQAIRRDGPALGAAHREWFLANHSAERWGACYRAVLRATAAGVPPALAGTPLDAPLTSQEREYSRAGLRGAPPFPEYRWGDST